MSVLDHAALPGWVVRFLDEPDAALDQILRGAVFLGPAGAADPGDLLIDWIGRYAEDLDIGEFFDERLAAWLEAHWDVPEHDDADPVVAADAWVRALNAVAYLDDVQHSAGLLRGRFDDRESRLAALVQGRHRDPLGRYLFAVAQHQDSRDLVPVWIRICELGPSVPLFHGAYGIEGVRRAPTEGTLEDGFPADVASALITVAEGLAVATQHNRVSRHQAFMELSSLVGVTLAAYPDDMVWRDTLLQAAGDERRASRAWLQEIAADLGYVAIDDPISLASAHGNESRFVAREIESDWAANADVIAARLDASDWTALDDASALIDVERSYARALGVSQPLVLSLVRFARLIERGQPHIADEWCGEARDWQPWNPYCWVVGLRARRRFDALGATELGWGAVERFPDNHLAFRELAVAVIMSGLPGEAEVLLRGALTKFPSAFHLVDILADALLKQNRIDEASAVLSEYPQATFPDSLYQRRTALIENARAEGVAPFSPASDGESHRYVVSRIRTLRRAATWTPDPAAIRIRAGAILQTAWANEVFDPRLLAEQVLLHLADDEPDAAADAIASHSRLARHPSLAYSRMRVWRDRARRDERTYAEAHDEAEEVANLVAESNPDILPVAHLAALRSMASLPDGRVKTTALEERGNVLAAWIRRIARHGVTNGDAQPSETPVEEATFLPTQLASRAFVDWWTRSVEQLVLLPASAEGGSGEAIEAALTLNTPQLDALEEDFIARATLGA